MDKMALVNWVLMNNRNCTIHLKEGKQPRIVEREKVAIRKSDIDVIRDNRGRICYNEEWFSDAGNMHARFYQLIRRRLSELYIDSYNCINKREDKRVRLILILSLANGAEHSIDITDGARKALGGANFDSKNLSLIEGVCQNYPSWEVDFFGNVPGLSTFFQEIRKAHRNQHKKSKPRKSR